MALYFDFLGELKEEKDLIVFDIPQLTVYVSSDGSKRYLALVEDDNGDELLLAEVKKEDLIDLLDCRAPLRTLLVKNEYVFSAIWNSSTGNWTVARVCVEEIDNSKLPVADVCFDCIDNELKRYRLMLQGYSDVATFLPDIIVCGVEKTRRRYFRTGFNRLQRALHESNMSWADINKIVGVALVL